MFNDHSIDTKFEKSEVKGKGRGSLSKSIFDSA